MVWRWIVTGEVFTWLTIRVFSRSLMANHSSVLAWRIPGAGEPGGLMSMGSQRVRHNQATELN